MGLSYILATWWEHPKIIEELNAFRRVCVAEHWIYREERTADADGRCADHVRPIR